MTRTREGTGAIPVVPDVRRGRGQAGSADVAIWVDPVEHGRRRGLGLGGFDEAGVDVFNVLLRLPLGAWVPADELEAFELDAVLGVPGLVEWDGGGIVRRAMPPVDPVVATVEHPSWRQALRTAGRFAQYCARRVRLSALPRDDSDLLMEASYWGVGVRVREPGGGAEELVPEAPFIAQRYTGASWLFAEQLYARYLADRAEA